MSDVLSFMVVTFHKVNSPYIQAFVAATKIALVANGGGIVPSFELYI